MKRREFFGRSLFGTVVAAFSTIFSTESASRAATRKFPDEYDASAELAQPDWKPVFFNDHQNETLIVLSDRIIPETDTPGARAALVNRFIDRLLAAETPEAQGRFLESLAFIDGESRKRHGQAFRYLSEESQTELLTFLAYPHNMVTWQSNRPSYPGHMHFARLKDWITRAYYTSEAGMKELGWDGNPFHGSFEGCPHPEGTHR